MAVRTGKRVRFERKNHRGEVWAIVWRCDQCEGEVGAGDRYCRTCGVLFDGNA